MGVYRANGQRVTKSGMPTVAQPQRDPLLQVTEDLFRTEPYAQSDAVLEGSVKTLLVRAGRTIRTSDLIALFPDATVASVGPVTGAAAGGTVVTIKGTNLDGVTAVTFGGTAGTALTVLSRGELQVTTPAKTAGAAAVSVVDDAGAVAAGNFTFA